MPRSAIWSFFLAVPSGDRETIRRQLTIDPDLARQSITIGAVGTPALQFFLEEIGRQVYTGDTALHIAAAAYRNDLAADLITHGANVRARNRLGAEPIHSAAVGSPASPTWNPKSQAAIIGWLIEAGADPNAVDKQGVTPLHRAVRTRCSAAVSALLAHGANPKKKNRSGSTPLDLTRHNTGRPGSGTPAAKKEQAMIVEILKGRSA